MYQTGHANFQQRLRKSDIAVNLVANWIQSYGIHVFKALDSDKVDNGDLIYIKNGNLYLVDVKHKQVDFTCQDDFPFPDLWVCQSHQWEDKDPSVNVFIILNKPMTHAAIVRDEYSDYWEEKVVDHPNEKNGKSRSLFCKKEWLEFYRIK